MNDDFPEPRSRQEVYLQEIITKLSNKITNNDFPEPRSRQEVYLQEIIKIINKKNIESDASSNGNIIIFDTDNNKKYIGSIMIINGKPILEYEELI